MARYLQDDLKAALEARESALAQVRSLAGQLSTARADYQTALQNYDVEAASAALVKIQVLETMTERANAAVPQVGHGDVSRSVSVAGGDLAMARKELREAARGCDGDSFADPELRRVLAAGIGAIPSYAAEAAEKVRLFVTETRATLAEIDSRLLVLNNLRGEQLNDIGSLLEQAERLADEARRLVGQAKDVRAAIAEANSKFLEGGAA